MDLKPALVSIILIVSLVLMAGCTQSPGNGPVTTAALVTNLKPEPAATPVQMATTISAPQQVVTIIHQVSLLKEVKDSELLFSLQVPVEWNCSTQR
jgi:uncharacterized lipoprotein YajG